MVHGHQFSLIDLMSRAPPCFAMCTYRMPKCCGAETSLSLVIWIVVISIEYRNNGGAWRCRPLFKPSGLPGRDNPVSCPALCRSSAHSWLVKSFGFCVSGPLHGLRSGLLA